MITSNWKLITTNLVLAAGLAILAGCATSSYDKGSATSNALSSTADAVARTSTSVNGVLAALNNLTFKSQGDLRSLYNAYVLAAKELDNAVAGLDAKQAALQNTAAAYLNNWTNQTAQIQSGDLRKLSGQQREQVAAKLDEVAASYRGVKDSIKMFTSDIRDIQTYLGTDLTASGVDSIKNIVAKTKVDAVPLRDSIKKLQGSFASLSAALSPVMPAASAK